MAFVIKQHDLLPNMTVAFTQADGTTPLDMSGATSVNIVVRSKGATAVEFKKPLAATDATQGLYFYAWTAGDTDLPGTKEFEFEIIWPGAKPQTIPADSYLEYTVVPDIG